MHFLPKHDAHYLLLVGIPHILPVGFRLLLPLSDSVACLRALARAPKNRKIHHFQETSQSQ